MRGRKNIIFLGILFLITYVGIAVLTFTYSNRLIEKGYLASEGTAAANFAVLTAANIHLTNEQVTRLKDCSYAELKQSEENQELKQMMSNDSFATKVDYAYIMVHLKDSEVKYRVTPENQGLFDAPVGTKLDIMWLLDVTVNPEVSELTTETVSSTDDLQRFAYYIDEDALIFGEAPTYIFHASEWGDHICGYAPFYTEEGLYVGVVGVELQTNDYNSYRTKAMNAVALLLLIITFTLFGFFLILYLKYKKLQFEKIYTDSLTHICNRSYYTDQFIRHLNRLHTQGHVFALMIADIDWFKKVNDTFGHEIGDEVLIEVAALLQETFGRYHTVRLGGEEFVVGFWAKDEAAIKADLDILYDKFRSHKFSRQQIDLTLSLGCTYCEPKELTGWLLSGMLKTADLKLYEVKENGRNQYQIVPYDGETDARKA